MLQWHRAECYPGTDAHASHPGDVAAIAKLESSAARSGHHVELARAALATAQTEYMNALPGADRDYQFRQISEAETRVKRAELDGDREQRR